jgi:hypothetical protein
LAFVEDEYVLILDETKGLQQTKRIGDIFSGAPSQPDAVFIVPQTAYTYFIKGNDNITYHRIACQTRQISEYIRLY